MLVKVIIVFILLLIFYSMGSALFYLVKGRNDDVRVVKALTWRIGLSILLFVLLFIAYYFGLIKPHQI